MFRQNPEFYAMPFICVALIPLSPLKATIKWRYFRSDEDIRINIILPCKTSSDTPSFNSRNGGKQKQEMYMH